MGEWASGRVITDGGVIMVIFVYINDMSLF